MAIRINSLGILIVLLVLSAIMGYPGILGIQSVAAERYAIEDKHGLIDSEGNFLLTQPPILYPIDNPDNNGDYLVDWSVVPSATGYQLEEDDNFGFTSPSVRYTGPASQYQVTGQYYGTWYYRVRTSNSGGNSQWSNTGSVIVTLAPPSSPILSPIVNPDGNGDYLVDWSDAPSAINYRLEEADSSGFISPTVRYEGATSQYAIISQQSGTWYYRVQADNEFGSGPWSNTEAVSVIPAAPLLLPIDNLDGDGSYLIDWNDVTGATSYRLEEAATSDFSSPTVRYEGTTGQYQVMSQPIGTWYYRVLAGNEGGDSPWSNTESVSVIHAPPAAPTLDPISNPDGNGDYLVDWNNVPSAASYQLEEANNPDFISSTVRYDGVDSIYQVTNQQAGTWYYRVRAVNGFGSGPWSNAESVILVPSAPLLFTIENTDGNGDYLTDWSDVPSASSYRLEEANNSDFISPTVRYEGAASQYPVTGQQSGSWYYRVLASNNGGESPWSNIESVSVLPQAPVLLPIDNADGNSDYLVDWSDVPFAINYRLEEADNSDFISPTVRYEGATSQYAIISQQAGTWYYRVLASNSGGDSSWSNIESVIVEQGAPASPILYPINNPDGNGDYLVEWSSVASAISYRLEEDDNSNFNSPTIRYEGANNQYPITAQPAGTWYYRVLATNAGGDSLWSNTASVSVIPEAPTLLPIVNPDGDGNYLVDWSDVIGATRYRLEEDDNADFTSPSIRYESTASQYQVNGQQVGTWYYRVLAGNAGGDSPWSNIESVIVNQGPQESPILDPISNPDGNGDYLTVWSVVTGASSYRLEEDDNGGFTSPTIRFEGAGNQYQITGQQSGTWYYRVLASNQYGNGPWSNIESVSVIPHAPVLSPIDNPDNDGHYLVDWSDVPGSTSYQLEEDDNASFTSPTIRFEGATSQYQNVSQLAGTWYYRVLARNAGGDSPWSNTESVTVITAPLTRKTFLPSVYLARQYPAGVQVLPTSFSYISHNTLYVIGEVLNNTMDSVTLVEVTVYFYDAVGHLLPTNNNKTYLWPLDLPAFDKGCFTIALDVPANWSSYRFGAPNFNRSATSSGINIFDDSGLYKAVNGDYEIIGKARNGGSQPANKVTVSGTLYNAAGVPVGCKHGYVDGTNLNPGQTSTFTLNFLGYYRDYSDVISYKLRVAGDLP